MPRPGIASVIPAIAACCIATAVAAFGASRGPMPSAAELTIDGVTYRDVRVLSTTPRDATIRHARGLTQIPLGKLPQKWQEALGYNPSASEFYAVRVEEEQQRRISRPAAAAPAEPAKARGTSWAPACEAENTLDGLVRAIYAPPVPNRGGVDMRPAFNRLSVHAKDRQWHPSGAVSAAISALEYACAARSGKDEKLSEEYLLWATMNVAGRDTEVPPSWNPQLGDPGNMDAMSGGAVDMGLGLMEVMQAMRTFGVPAYDRMPTVGGIRSAPISAPGYELTGEARGAHKIKDLWLNRGGNTESLGAIINLLNRDVPVLVSIKWPDPRTLAQAPLLSRQPPMPGASHVVILAGYALPPGVGDVRQARFIFRNSRGPGWGVDGCGYATWEYLQQNMLSSVFLVVE